jgi:hypothetical protein
MRSLAKPRSGSAGSGRLRARNFVVSTQGAQCEACGVGGDLCSAGGSAQDGVLPVLPW